MNVRYRMIGAAGVAVMALAGCTSGGGGDVPGSSPVPMPTSRVTSAPTVVSTSPSPARTGPLTTGPNLLRDETLPSLLPIARKRDPGGALAFASFYYEAVNWSFSTNDSYLLREISARSCKNCQYLIRGIDGLKPKSQVLSGGHVFVDSAQVQMRSYSDALQIVKIVLSQEAATVTNSSGGRMVVANPVRHKAFLISVRWVSGGWIIAGVSTP